MRKTILQGNFLPSFSLSLDQFFFSLGQNNFSRQNSVISRFVKPDFFVLLGDPNWEPPENYEDSDFDDSVISEDEIADLVESLKSEVRIAEIYPEKVIKFSY